LFNHFCPPWLTIPTYDAACFASLFTSPACSPFFYGLREKLITEKPDAGFDLNNHFQLFAGIDPQQVE
jgi:hypothetical protein